MKNLVIFKRVAKYTKEIKKKDKGENENEENGTIIVVF